MKTQNVYSSVRFLVPLFLLVVAFWTIPGCGGGSSGSGSLDFEGKVLVADSGEPVPGTTVTREDTGDQAVADENGDFVLSTEFATSILLRFQGQFERSKRAAVSFDISQAVNVQERTRISTFDALVDAENQTVTIANQQNLDANRNPVDETTTSGSGSDVSTSDGSTDSSTDASTSTTDGATTTGTTGATTGGSEETTTAGGTTSAGNTATTSTSTSGDVVTASSSSDTGSGTAGAADASTATSSGGSGSVDDSGTSATVGTTTAGSIDSGSTDSSAVTSTSTTGTDSTAGSDGTLTPPDPGDTSTGSGGSTGGDLEPPVDNEEEVV